ncbi:hypothetical protein COV49_00780 [Candidatus Falkowbacteria bacterium CG11_big_fil_rev_8_21_14_0_20_39_10]|uniref:Methyltransferase type 11 domain-containing protein n=1 Tax=Candidatus Falkowbacteria bacterium CG11_big_fil_rev_8_21_14_0_20_39_10 TaxID=1974570 RepID=A0A2M6K9Y4_9BACT|nr:MAG: hypothetical protein COV49_00780 [Candidatus Falkowbacteria bacterium CG11_big_fil_rev_8_21_14_0_20_39_10]
MIFNTILKKFAEYTLFLPFDVFERHKFIGSFVTDNATILDVGGSMSQLDKFSSPSKIVTADIKPPADIVYDGKQIPVDDGSYDIVTSIDVLEHVPPKFRKEFVKELNRIARKSVIISAPLGTKTHSQYEKEELENAKKQNIDIPYLEEHVELGLPTPELITSFAQKYGGTIFYSGNLSINRKLFRIHTFEVKNPLFNLILFFLKLIFNMCMNLGIYQYMTRRSFSESINRFYLVIEKK